jgi:hypothetical protein
MLSYQQFLQVVWIDTVLPGLGGRWRSSGWRQAAAPAAGERQSGSDLDEMKGDVGSDQLDQLADLLAGAWTATHRCVSR